ncbi:MAG TPA: DNA primase [Candidatus Limnocylindria bacterium]|nr:DNA primase [Candidatus Limnocylindria bacterium]
MTSSGVAAEIKSKLSVLEVVGETVQLKRAGSAYKGLCPFHAEKTPSFVVTPDRETWRCFGCGEGGDIFTFLMRRDGLDFREALERLAERAGVELSERTAREDRQRKRLRDALEAAIAWYREVLLQAAQAQKARDYLAERGLAEETLERFTIGYAPNTWDALTKRLIAKGFSNAEMIGAGLASPSNRGGVIDKFRGRIIIPIRDASARAVGLGGRVMPNGEGPKYLNSPATMLFDKSRTLYGIDLARAAIRREKLAVIVEGYTDVMAAHQAGFTNVVASLGTALTRGQVELATRYADAVALAYDVDLAGEAATQRGLLEELGPDQAVSKVRVVRIPAGKDPDELIRTDPDTWRAAVADAPAVLDYFMDRAVAAVDVSSVAGRREVTRRVLGVLRRVADPLERTLYLQRLSRIVDVDEKVLADALASTPVPAPRRAPAADGAAPGERVSASLPPLEAETLRLLLRHPEIAGELGDARLPFRDAAAAALATAWRDRTDPASTGEALEAFVATLDAATAELARDLLAEIRADPGPRMEPDAARDALHGCLRRLRVQRIEETIRDGRLLIDEADRDGDADRVRELERQMTILGREKAELTNVNREPAAAGARRS